MPAGSSAPPSAPSPDSIALAAALEARLSNLWVLLMTGTPVTLSRTAAGVLGTLRDDGPQRVTDLARVEGVAQPTMTSIVARLRRDGLLDSAPDPADARASLLSVTDIGRAALQERVQARAELLAARIENLSDAERAAIAGAFAALEAVVPERSVSA